MSLSVEEVGPEWAVFNFTQARDSDFSETFQLTDEDDSPIDLTSYTVKAELRESQNKTSTLLDTFTVNVADLASGTVVLTLTDTQTDDVTVEEAFYSILYTSPTGIDKTWFKGKITFENNATET